MTILTAPDPVARAQAPPVRVARRTAARPQPSILPSFVPADPAATQAEAPRRDTAAGRTSTASGDDLGGLHHWPIPNLPDTPNSAGSASGAGGGITLLLLVLFAAANAAQLSVPHWRSWRVRLNRDEPHVTPLAKPRDRPG
ncbi:MAG TPA: hypothetical protein VEH52_05920 [Gaiellaceae bacterium]|nr:hypothetical protein [Gaiellaceae bacterium]